jgi:hypothetical protein
MPEIKIHHLWAGLPLFILLWKCFLFPLPLLDFWWHLKAGEIIVSTRTIPSTDLFSYTAAGRTFILGNWLAEVIYYLVFRLGSFSLLVFANASLVMASFLPVYRLCWEATSRPRVRIMSAALAALCFFVGARSQIFSFFFFALYYWILTEFRTRRRDLLWILPALMILWVNLHGAFVLGILLIGIVLCSESTKAYLGLESAMLSVRELRKLALMMLLCAAATIANPEGLGIYRYLRAVAADPSSQRLVIEWQPPRIDTPQGVLLFYGPFFLLLIVLLYSKRRPDITDAVLFLASSAFALTATRNIIWFIIISAPLLARYSPAGPVQAAGDDRKAPVPGSERRLLNLLLAVAAIFVLALLSPWVHPRVYGASLVAPETPVGAMDYIQSHRLQGRIFHPQEYGDYLIWRLWPQHRSFIDGRVHLFGESFVREYQQIFCDSGWERSLDSYDVRYMLLNKDPDRTESVHLMENARTSPGWTVLYEDGITVLFEKKPAASRTLDLK